MMARKKTPRCYVCKQKPARLLRGAFGPADDVRVYVNAYPGRAFCSARCAAVFALLAFNERATDTDLRWCPHREEWINIYDEACPDCEAEGRDTRP